MEGRRKNTRPDKTLLRAKHAGVCRVCKNVNSGIDGCKQCTQKPADLQYERIVYTGN